MAESRTPKTAEGCSTNVGWAKKANNEGKLTLLLPLLQDLFHSCKLSGSSFMHRCSHKGAKCGRQGVTKPKNERQKCIIHAESLQCSVIPFFRADRSAINFGYMILYFWHLPLFLFYLQSEMTWVFTWNICSGQTSQQCQVSPRDCKGGAVTQVVAGSSHLINTSSAPLSTGFSALTGTLLKKRIKRKEGLKKERGRRDHRKRNRRLRMGRERNLQSTQKKLEAWLPCWK